MKNGRAGQHVHKITVMLEAFHIMLAGEYWLSKAMHPRFLPNGLIASVHFSTTTNASVNQCWHLSLVLCPLHAPLDLKT